MESPEDISKSLESTFQSPTSTSKPIHILKDKLKSAIYSSQFRLLSMCGKQGTNQEEKDCYKHATFSLLMKSLIYKDLDKEIQSIISDLCYTSKSIYKEKIWQKIKYFYDQALGYYNYSIPRWLSPSDYLQKYLDIPEEIRYSSAAPVVYFYHRDSNLKYGKLISLNLENNYFSSITVRVNTGNPQSPFKKEVITSYNLAYVIPDYEDYNFISLYNSDDRLTIPEGTVLQDITKEDFSNGGEPSSFLIATLNAGHKNCGFFYLDTFNIKTFHRINNNGILENEQFETKIDTDYRTYNQIRELDTILINNYNYDNLQFFNTPSNERREYLYKIGFNSPYYVVELRGNANPITGNLLDEKYYDSSENYFSAPSSKTFKLLSDSKINLFEFLILKCIYELQELFTAGCSSCTHFFNCVGGILTIIPFNDKYKKEIVSGSHAINFSICQENISTNPKIILCNSWGGICQDSSTSYLEFWKEFIDVFNKDPLKIGTEYTDVFMMYGVDSLIIKKSTLLFKKDDKIE